VAGERGHVHDRVMARDPMRPRGVNWFIVRLFLILGILMSALGALLEPILLLIGVGWIGMALVLGTLFWWMRRRVDRREALRHEGAPGTATVLEANRTHTKVNSSGGVGGIVVYKMRLRIEAEGMEPFELEKRLAPRVGLSGLQPGQKWPVYVDRNDREHIMVDWDALLASGTTIQVGSGVTIHSQGQLEMRPGPDPRRVVFDVLRGRGITVQGAPATSAPAPQDHGSAVGERLHQLQQLKNQGLISDEEFETQRARLVDSL
jgi:hypothetical protein